MQDANDLLKSRQNGNALDTQKGLEPDKISPLILKKIILDVKKPLAVLFNLSLLTGVFPCVWKKSYVDRLF
jgi:hypothetical protein